MSISPAFLTPDLRSHLPFPLTYLFGENPIWEANADHIIRGEPQNLYERKVKPSALQTKSVYMKRAKLRTEISQGILSDTGL